MVWRIAEEVLVWNVFFAAVFLTPPLVLSLEKKPNPATVAYLPVLARPLDCDATVNVRVHQHEEGATRCYVRGRK